LMKLEEILLCLQLYPWLLIVILIS